MKSKKDRIIEAAIALFADTGYHNTSISQIAKKAEVSKGLMYNYFESKDELLKYIVDIGVRKLMENFDPNRDGVLTKEEFIFYIQDVFIQMQNDREFWLLFFNILSQPSIMQMVGDRMFEIIGPMMQELTDYFIKKGCEDPEAETRYFVAVMDGVGMHYLLDPEGYPIRSVIKKIIKEFV